MTEQRQLRIIESLSRTNDSLFKFWVYVDLKYCLAVNHLKETLISWSILQLLIFSYVSYTGQPLEQIVLVPNVIERAP